MLEGSVKFSAHPGGTKLAKNSGGSIGSSPFGVAQESNMDWKPPGTLRCLLPAYGCPASAG